MLVEERNVLLDKAHREPAEERTAQVAGGKGGQAPGD